MRRPRRPRFSRNGQSLSRLLDDGDDTVTFPAPGRYRTAPVGPARTHTTSGQGWTMTVDEDAPPVPVDARLRAAHQSMTLKARYLEAEGMGYRIDDAAHLRERGDKVDGRSVIARAGREGAAHLLGPRQDWLTRNSGRPWEPAGGWDHGWARGLNWYRPEDGDTGLPCWRPGRQPEPAPDPPRPWWVPEDPSGVRAAYERAFNGNGAA